MSNHKNNSTGGGIGGNGVYVRPITGTPTTGHTIPTQILDDLSTRFIINIPKGDRDDLIRVCFQLELAHWHYLDLICGKTPHPLLPRPNFTRFCQIMFTHIPFLTPHLPNIDTIIAQWKEYKLLVPTCGAILLDPTLQYVLLVKGFGGNSWGFPKGKINESEPYVVCAAREVKEETGYDCSDTISDQIYLERSVNEKTVRLYIVRDVKKDFPFAPLARNEIKDIKWFAVADLPVRTYSQEPDPNQNPNALKANPNHFYNVCPFVKPLRRWVFKERQQSGRDQRRKDRDGGGGDGNRQAGGHQHQSDLFWAKSWDNIKFDWDNIWRQIHWESKTLKT